MNARPDPDSFDEAESPRDSSDDPEPLQEGYGPFENPGTVDDEARDASIRGGRDLPQPSRDLTKNMERLDALLAAADDEEKLQAGMGIRLALGMAQELKEGKALGSETGELVAEWTRKYGSEAVDAAIKVARQFLLKPEEMRMALGKSLNLGMGRPE